MVLNWFYYPVLYSNVWGNNCEENQYFFWKITVSAFFACHPSFYVIDLGSIPDNTFKTGGNLRKSKHNKFSLFFLNTIHKIYNRIHEAYNGFFKKYLFIYIMIIQISGSNKSTFFNLQSFLTIPQFFIWSNWNNLCVLSPHRNIKKKKIILKFRPSYIIPLVRNAVVEN